MRNLCLGMLACVLVSGAAVGQEPMPLQIMPNSPAGRTYGPVPSWQAPPAPVMAYPAVYPAVWQFGPNPNAMAIPAFQNDYLPNPGMVVGPPLQGPMALPPLPLMQPKQPIVQTKGHALSCAPPPPPACPPCPPEPVCAPAPACPPPEPFLMETSPWQPVRVHHCYAMGDYLVWWTKKQAVPVETAAGFPEFDLPDNGPRQGARLTLGSWLNPSRTLALEASGFWLERQALATTVDQGADPLAVELPFFLGIDSQISSVEATSQLWGAEANFRYKCCEICGGHCRFFADFLAGFRYLDLSEGLTFTSSTLFSTAPVLFSGAQVDTSDWVGTHNHIYAPQFGLEAGVMFGRCQVSLYSKIAAGINQQSVNQVGQSVVTAPPLPLGNLATSGGLLIQAPGRFSQDVFAYVPEAGVNFSFKLCEWCQVGAGYTFLYVGNVVRPADHFPAGVGGVPQSVLTLQGIPPVAQPPFTFNQTNYWVQGGNFRITFLF